MTWTRYVPDEEGPGPHIHKEHLDAFFILTGELNFGLGPDVERVKADRTPLSWRPRTSSTRSATTDQTRPPGSTFTHLPGFASFLRDTDFVWDSFDTPANGSLPLSEAIMDHVHSA